MNIEAAIQSAEKLIPLPTRNGVLGSPDDPWKFEFTRDGAVYESWEAPYDYSLSVSDRKYAVAAVAAHYILGGAATLSLDWTYRWANKNRYPFDTVEKIIGRILEIHKQTEGSKIEAE